MEKKEKLGFFKKMFLVMTDFRTYPFLVKHEKFSKTFLYLLTLVLIVSLILALNIMLSLDVALDSIVENYENNVPEFELSNNTLNVSEKIGLELSENSYLLVNTDYKYDEYRKLKEYGKLYLYDTVTLVTKDKILVEFRGVPQYDINFSEFNYELDKQGLLDELLAYSTDEGYKLYLSFSIYIIVFMTYFILIMFKVLFVSCVVAIMGAIFGIQLNLANYLKIGIYSYTLPLILEVIAICIVGEIKDYAHYATLMLTYVYAIYVMRAIKLDAFIIMFSNKKNIKHTSSEFEEELRKYRELVQKEENNTEKDESENDKQDDDKK